MRADPFWRFQEGIDLWVKRSEEMFIADFRDLVWAIFCRILERTPQYSGKAVANWNIGVGAPDDSEANANYGSPAIVKRDAIRIQHIYSPHQTGSPQWIEVAKARNKPRLALIKRGTRVYFSNNVYGDDDDGNSDEYYLGSLQEASYWMEKLRTVNKPYEIAAETVLFALAEQGRLPGRRFRAGGGSIGDADPGTT